MKRILKSFVTAVLLVAVMLSSMTATALTISYDGRDNGIDYSSLYDGFSDVPESHWAYKEIENCKKRGLINGYLDGSFNPDDEILRSEAMKIFVIFLGLPINDVKQSSYDDVGVADWYAPYIEVGNKLFPPKESVDGNAMFYPMEPITREDAIYALVTALGFGTEVDLFDESVLDKFSDCESISSDIKPYVAFAVACGLVRGDSDETIRAQKPLTRAQFAVLLYRASSFPGPMKRQKETIQDILIEPSLKKEIVIGESFEITAKAVYSDGTIKDYSDELNPYTESPEGIVVINRNKIKAIGEGTAIINFNNEKMIDRHLIVTVEKAESTDILD